MMETANTRHRNLRTLLYALDSAGEATAAHLAEQTGLSVATISRGLSFLKSKKLVIQRRKDTAEVGRRPDVFSINGAYAHCFYCRLYGDTISGYLLDLSGKVVAKESVEASAEMTADAFLKKLLETLWFITTLPCSIRSRHLKSWRICSMICSAKAI